MENKMLNYIQQVISNMPADWLNLTTHRLDIYDESKAKTQFLEQFEALYQSNNADAKALSELPTAYDYIRLGHPLSSVLEWTIANQHNLKAEAVISFSSKTVPVLAILRTNLMHNKKTLIAYSGELPSMFNAEAIKAVYGYNFELHKVADQNEISDFDGSVVYISTKNDVYQFNLSDKVDFYINNHKALGSILLVNKSSNEAYISEIQHVRRRETIAMTPANCLAAFKILTSQASFDKDANRAANKAAVLQSIKEVTQSKVPALVGSSGLSMQYAIVMGLIDHARENHPGKNIKIIVPPNCYGGTNDQARRVAACLPHVEVMDLPVDGGNNMVQSVNTVLSTIADENAVPYIIAEIPTNPRVEVPEMMELAKVLEMKRTTTSGADAIAPVFILDQTFCPNVHFLGEGEILAGVQTIAYVSGSKFPSGGKCTAGYCVANEKAAHLMPKVELHLNLCDNEATDLQMEILANQMPSMNERIAGAYKNTREFVNFIQEQLPTAKINFVSEELAAQSFTPSVFSLDLPTKGETDEERENYKRALNLKLIDMMITQIPNESKYCVSYGQLKGCYWTVPATSTQGTTKEGDKDYIARVALSQDMDLEKHKSVFAEFVKTL